jgi:hypothetical protein
MRRVLLLSAAVVVAVVACRDVTQQNPKQAKLAPKASASAAPAAPEANASTVCAAYRQQLAQARTAMTRTPDDESLKQNVDTYQAIIADACN